MNPTHEANPVRVFAWEIYEIEEPTSETGFFAVSKLGYRQHLSTELTTPYMPSMGDYVVKKEDGCVYVSPKHVFENEYHPF